MLAGVCGDDDVILQYWVLLLPTMTPAQMRKLIEHRDETFMRTVNKYGNSLTYLRFLRNVSALVATPVGEDPAALLQAAARDHIAASPKSKGRIEAAPPDDKLAIPGPEE